jgi:hypothetical protein
MTTYHNDQSIKDKYITRVRLHREADELIQGTGWEDGKGCAVGCTLENYSHARYPIELGLPEWLAFLEDHIFEALAPEEAQKWPEQFLQAIPVGVSDRSMDVLRDRFQIFWLTRQKSQIDCAKYTQVAKAIDDTIALLQSAINGEEPESAAWSAGRSAAWSAAWSAAESAAWSAAESAGRSAAESAAESAAWSAGRSAGRSAAWSAARSAAESAAWSEAIVKRDWLLENLAALK